MRHVPNVSGAHGLPWFLLSTLVWVLSSSLASAQAPWILLPISEDDPAADGSGPAALASEVRLAFGATEASFMDDEGASLTFEQEVSSPATSLTQSELDQWADRSRSALQALALADYDTAREELLEAQRVSQQAAEELNREAERAREVLDTCLFMARALLETRQRAEALRQVRGCRVLVPELEPRFVRHTPEVRALLERVDAEDSGADLQVSSSPSGCIVRVNGTPQGETPFTMRNIARGEYRVQVECTEARGRVRRVLVDEGVAQLHVDASFDENIDSRPLLFARPGFAPVAGAQRVASATNRTVLVAMRDGANYRFWRVEPGQGAAPGRVTEVRSNAANLAIAAGALAERRSIDLRYDTPRPIGEVDALAEGEEEDEDDAPQGGSLPRWRIATGIGASVAGAGLFGLATYFHLDRKNIGDGFASLTEEQAMGRGFIPNQRAWLERGLAPAALSAFAGGAVLGAGLGMLVPPNEEMPWWAWASGGLGIAVGAAALIPVLTRPECTGDGIASFDQRVRSDCIDRDLAGSQAALIGAAALPFLAVPISALLQRGGGENAQVAGVSASLDENSFSLVIQGTLR